MRSFYDLDPAVQQERAFARLRRYLRDHVEAYHPFLRKHYRDAGVSASAVRTIDDFRRLPILEKQHLRL